MRRPKKLTPQEELNIEHDVRMLLHAGRDCMRNQKRYDTTLIRYDVNNPYYAEAFGIMRALATLGYGYLETTGRTVDSFPKHDLRRWFNELEDAVLSEEHFDSTHECDYCLEKYGKDDTRRKDRTHAVA